MPGPPAGLNSPVLQVAGLLLSAAGVVFVALAIVTRWSEVRDGLAGVSASWLAAAFILAASAMVFIALRWRASIRLFGEDLPPGETVALFFRGEIAKYVPGSVWAVIGRAELVRRRGISWRTAYASVTLSVVAMFSGAACAAALFAPLSLHLNGWAWALWGVCVLLGGGGVVLAGASIVARRGSTTPGSTPKVSLRRLAALVLAYLPAWLLIGGATWCVARSVSDAAQLGDVLFATAVSWLAGFLALPAPGGIGVREAAFVAVLGPLPGAVTVTIAVLARILFMVTDAAGAALALIPRGRSRQPLIPPGTAAAEPVAGAPE